MSFLLLFLSGIAGGILGGMGMGGGTALIPLLTIACGVSQTVAQGVNLVSFLPMSVMALSVHAKSGFLVKRGIFHLIVPAFLFSGIFSLLAVCLPAEALRTGFGIFLVILSLFQFRSVFAEGENQNA